MAEITYDVSYYLTLAGVRCIFKKLFDPNTSVNQAFYNSDGVTPATLRVFDDYLVEDLPGVITYDTNSILLTYELRQSSPSRIRKLQVFTDINVGGGTIELEGNRTCMRFYDETDNKIKFKFTLKQVTECLPKEQIPIMIQSLVNLNNIKITKIFVGSGTPDLSGESSNLTNLVNSFRITKRWYLDNKSVRLIATTDDEAFINNNITELGVGYREGGTLDDPGACMDNGTLILDKVAYKLNTLQSTDFMKLDHKTRYNIEVDIYLV